MAGKNEGVCANPKQIKTDVDCRSARPKFDNGTWSPAKISDVTGGGLYLFVTPDKSKPGDAASKLWRMDYRFRTRRKTYSIGPYGNGKDGTFSLADARRERDKAKDLLKEGKDPSTEKQLETAAIGRPGSAASIRSAASSSDGHRKLRTPCQSAQKKPATTDTDPIHRTSSGRTSWSPKAKAAITPNRIVHTGQKLRMIRSATSPARVSKSGHFSRSIADRAMRSWSVMPPVGPPFGRPVRCVTWTGPRITAMWGWYRALSSCQTTDAP